MAQEARVHVVNKSDSKEHLTLPISTANLPPLSPGQIRLQTYLMSLTANNLSYARLGHIAHWWDAFPVPSSLPEPYNDPSLYGIVPAWGYAKIISSRNEGLEEGTILYGFWPSCTLPIDLQLAKTEPNGHYIDTTPSRQCLWSYYHRYTLPYPQLSLQDLASPSLAAQTVFRPLFECAHTLNTYVLGPLAIHPCPRTCPDEIWQHADLSNTALIVLSASGKTARAFTDAVLLARAPGSGPLGLLAITSNPSALSLHKAESATPTLTISYAASLTSSTSTFLSSLRSIPQKILIADFGSRADSLPSLSAYLSMHFPSTPLATITVGTSPSHSLADSQALFANIPNRRQMNTSEVREAVVDAVGEQAYFDGVRAAWEGFCRRGGCEDEGLRVHVGRGVEAFEEGWEGICQGKGLSGGLAYLFER